MKKYIKYIIIILVVILLTIWIPIISLAYNIDTPIEDFNGDFDAYLKCVKTLTSSDVESKITDQYFKERYGDDWKTNRDKWAHDKQKIQEDCNSMSDYTDKQQKQQIEGEEQYLSNAFVGSTTVRPYEAEYKYLYTVEFFNGVKEAEDSVDKNASGDELVRDFRKKLTSIKSLSDTALNNENLSSDQLEEIRQQINKQMQELKALKDQIEKDDSIDQETKDEIEKEFQDVDQNYYKKVSEETKEQEIKESTDSPIYQYPQKTSKNDGSEESLEDLIQDGDAFLTKGNTNLNQTALQNFSKTMYNILLAVGVVVAVIVGALIGIKLMASSVEEQAEAKKLVVPYIVGCLIVFGGFGIWKIVVVIIQGI